MNDRLKKYYEENGKKIFLYLMVLCNDEQLAEELTQETFYRALKRLKTFRGDSSVYTWLCGIAKNLWYEYIRNSKNRTVDISEIEFTETGRQPDELAEEKSENLSMLKILHGLPENEKEIILLRASAGLSFRDIGEIFDKSENWARVTYYRAKQKMKG